MKKSVMSLPKKVILDLLPSYLAKEASQESQELIEEYAKKDPQIAKIIIDGKMDEARISSDVPLPDHLETKTIMRLRRKIRSQLIFVALGTILLLLIPLAAIHLTEEVNWNLADFAVMGFLIFGAGLMYILISSIVESLSYKFAIGIAILTLFLLAWINLAVGFIGSVDNPMNLIYFGVPIIVVFGAIKYKLRAGGMDLTMFLAALFQFIIPTLLFLLWNPSTGELKSTETFTLLNTLFALLLAISGLLFRRAKQKSFG